MSNKEEKKWLTIREAAARAGCSYPTMKKYMDKGEVRHSRLDSGVYKIKREWVDEWLERHEVSQGDSAVDRLYEEMS